MVVSVLGEVSNAVFAAASYLIRRARLDIPPGRLPGRAAGQDPPPFDAGGTSDDAPVSCNAPDITRSDGEAKDAAAQGTTQPTTPRPSWPTPPTS
jgi:hypothetical protein